MAIEHCQLHRRIALNCLRVMGTSLERLSLAFIVPTSLLSMWISNTATCAMMVPIMEAMISELSDNKQADSNGNGKSIENEIKGLNFRHNIFKPTLVYNEY